MTLWQSLVLGAVEGITEFLPVSSTAHLMFTEKLFGLAPDEFTKSFTITVQLAAILAVCLRYGKKLAADVGLLKSVGAAFLPTAAVGFVLYKIIKGYLLANAWIAAAMLAAGGLFLILFEKFWAPPNAAAPSGLAQTKPHLLTYRSAFLIGLAQALAVIPGVSRSAATIVAGLLLGMRREAIVEFSFLLAIPTMLAATLYDLVQSGSNFSAENWHLLASGSVAAFVFAWISVSWLLSYVRRHTFTAFGIYRIAAAAAFALLVIER